MTPQPSPSPSALDRLFLLIQNGTNDDERRLIFAASDELAQIRSRAAALEAALREVVETRTDADRTGKSIDEIHYMTAMSAARSALDQAAREALGGSDGG